MRRAIEKPLFRMPFSNLAQLGDTAASLIVRDMIELGLFGITAATKTAIEQNTVTLKEYPTDIELLSEVSYCVEERLKAEDDVKVQIREIMHRAKSLWGEDHSRYRSFGTHGMDAMSVSDLHRCACQVVRIGTLRLTELTPKGLTQAILDTLEDRTAELDTWIDKKVDAVNARDEATCERIATANALYKKIVDVFDIGKNYWFTRNEAKYNDYVIYNTPNAQPAEPGQYGAASGSMLTINNQPVESARVSFQGVENPVYLDEHNNWECDMVPVTCTKIYGTADDCYNFVADIVITADGNTHFDIRMVPTNFVPPPVS